MTLVKRNGQVNNQLPTLWEDFFNRDVFNWGSNYSSHSSNVPAVNIRETPDLFLVEMAAPGMEKKDFKIELDGNTLTISSEKQSQQVQNESEIYSRKEFNYQSFYRTFHLPKDVVDSEKIKARYENGLLNLEIPKREEVKQKPARNIEIS